MKYRFAIMFSSVLIASTMTYCADAGGTQYRGFPTQQGAAEAFLRSVATGDFTGALSVFDCGLAASAYTFPNKVARLTTINPTFTIPTEYAGFVELNHISLRNRAAGQLLLFVYNLLLKEKYAPFPYKGIPAKGESPAERRQEAEEFSRSVDPAGLAGIKFLHLDTAISFLQKDDDESFVESISKTQQAQIEAEGFEDVMDCVMYFSWNESVYVCGVIFTQYADGWHVNSLASHIGGIATGEFIKLNATPDEFERAMEADLIHSLFK